MPAIPIAESRAPIVVGISATSSAIRVAIETVGPGEVGERAQRDHDDQEDQRQPGEQDPERDLVRRLAPAGALDQGDHPVEEALAGLLGDLDDDPVREHPGAAGDRAAVAAGLADHRGRLAGHRRLVDRGDALDHGPVAGDHLAGLDDDDVAALASSVAGDRAAVAQAGDGLGAHRAQGVGLGLAAALGERLGEVAEDHRQPQPERDDAGEPGRPRRRRRAARRRTAWIRKPTVVNSGADLDHEHHRVVDHRPRIELDAGCRRSPCARVAALKTDCGRSLTDSLLDRARG